MKRLSLLIISLLVGLMLLSGCSKMSMAETDEHETAPRETSADEGNTYKAENTVISFIKALQASDFESVSKMVYMPTGSFYSADDIAWFMPRSDYAPLIGTGDAIDPEMSSGGSTIEKKVACYVGKDAYVFTLILGDDNTWRITIPNAYTENWSIKVPGRCAVTVDGKDVSEYLQPAAPDANYGLYTFPAIISNTHSVTVTSSWREIDCMTMARS